MAPKLFQPNAKAVDESEIRQTTIMPDKDYEEDVSVGKDADPLAKTQTERDFNAKWRDDITKAVNNLMQITKSNKEVLKAVNNHNVQINERLLKLETAPIKPPVVTPTKIIKDEPILTPHTADEDNPLTVISIANGKSVLFSEIILANRFTNGVRRIIWHCAATRPLWMANSSAVAKALEIKNWHVNDRKWSDIGYHFFIDRDGTIVYCRWIGKMGAHTRGENSDTFGICLAGGHGSSENDSFEENFTQEQAIAMLQLEKALKTYYPQIESNHGHNEFAAKACPGFNIQKFF